ncbi:TadE/TadG family type IV pilus assembly protein [Candidatus Clostridium radicumherbarum]|uniref:TadE/TadG family type IV pilus assembly protein n=1 Tax=Candidatus Clostridium radicumherbarum TaxID=3381662 RepID=A0ABW8TUG7_9CLOT
MKKKKGQALVETALVVPILILFICMIIDTGRIIYAESRLNLICQEATRIASLGGSSTDVKNYAYNKLDSASAATLDSNTSYAVPNSTTYTTDNSQNKSGNFVKVDLSVKLQYITPLASLILPSPFVATAESIIRIE